MAGTLHEDQNTFLTVFRPFLLRMKYVADKSCRGNKDIHFIFNIVFRK
jgi:hypothetical protein